MSRNDDSDVFSEESDYRLQHVREQELSGLSVADYCRRHDICAATFYNWRRLRRECGARRVTKDAVTFTEIGRMESSRTPWAAEIALASGAVVRVSPGADAQLLRAVFEALG